MKRFVFLLTLVFIAVLFVSCKTYDEPVNKNREVISVVFQERDGDTDIYVITYDDGSTSILEVPNDGNDTSQDMLDCDHKYGKYTYMHINGNDDETPCEDRYYYSICVKCNLLDWRKGNYGDHSFITETTLPTCIASGFDTDVCSFCGKVEIKNFTEKTEHKISTTYLTDATNHWYQCMICDQKIASESHVRSEAFVRNSIESTCYSEGSYEAEVCCEVCNVPRRTPDRSYFRYRC